MGTLTRPHRYLILKWGDFRPQFVEARSRQELYARLRPEWGQVVMACRYHGEHPDTVLVRKMGHGLQDVFLGAIWIGQLATLPEGDWGARVFTSPSYHLSLLATYHTRKAALRAVLESWHLTLEIQSRLRTSQEQRSEVY